jgi:HEAT repeat protein
VKTLLLFAAASVMFAQDIPSFSNAHLETRAFSGNLDSQLRSTSPTWYGYQVKTTQRDESCCWSDSNRGCWLEDHSGHQSGGLHSNGPVHLEGSAAAAVLYRVANNQIEKVQLYSMSCPLDAGGLPVVWLTGVPMSASLAELRQLDSPNATDRLTDSAIFAIAQHDDPQADTILNQLAAPSQPERTREKVSFWLGTSRGVAGVRMLQQMLKNDPSDKVREKVVFGLYVSKEPQGAAALLEAAKYDSSPRVRSQAIFWIAQKAGKQAAATIANAIENDPNTEVKKKAVFALSQLPKDDGIPKLIEVARTQKNPEVRKQAFFWLGQSGDPRALAFFEQVLAK